MLTKTPHNSTLSYFQRYLNFPDKKHKSSMQCLLKPIPNSAWDSHLSIITIDSSAKQKPANRRTNMRHNAATLRVGVPVSSKILSIPVVDYSLVTLFDVVLAAVIYRIHERELIARLIGRAIVREAELVAFGVIVVEGVWVRVL